jgi:hypothetical protein
MCFWLIFEVEQIKSKKSKMLKILINEKLRLIGPSIQNMNLKQNKKISKMSEKLQLKFFISTDFFYSSWNTWKRDIEKIFVY